LTVVDGNELRWVDLHKEAGKELTLYLPERVAPDAAIGEIDLHTHVVAHRYDLRASDAPLDEALASLPVSAPKLDPRGPDEMFAALFSEPFGPASFARYAQEHARDEPEVFGVSAEDRERMHDLLELTAERARVERRLGGGALAGVGLLLAGAGAWGYAESTTSDDKTISVLGMGLGGGLLAAGAVAALLPSTEEGIFDSYVTRLGRSDDPVLVLADTENQLLALAHRYRRERLLQRGLSIGLGVLALGLASVDWAVARDDDARVASVYFGGAVVLAAGLGIGTSFLMHPTEIAAEIWSKDPSRQRLTQTSAGLEVHPTIGLGSLGLQGSF
jgi:hypothetical protein